MSNFYQHPQLFLNDFYLNTPSLLTPAPFSPSSLILYVQALASSPWMEQEQTDCPAPCCLPSHPDYTHHPSDASISPNPAAFPLNTAWPWPAAQNSHGPGSNVQERVTNLMGTQCTMSDTHSVPVHSVFRLCGGKNSMPLALQHEAYAS